MGRNWQRLQKNVNKTEKYWLFLECKHETNFEDNNKPGGFQWYFPQIILFIILHYYM